MRTETDRQDVSAQATAAYLHKVCIPFVLSIGDRVVRNCDRLDSLEEIEYELAQNPKLAIELEIGPKSGLMQFSTRPLGDPQARRYFDELMDGVFVNTPTFSGKYCGRLFRLDKRLASLRKPTFTYGSVFVDVGGDDYRVTLPPGSSSMGQVKWIRSLEDCQGRFQRVPDFVIDRLIAENEFDEEDELFPAELSSAVDW